MVTPPSISATSFNCPHCGALAQQFWWKLLADAYKRGEHPGLIYPHELGDLLESVEGSELEEDKKLRLAERFKLAATGAVIFSGKGESEYGLFPVTNLYISRCYHCDKASVWIYDRLVWPAQHEAPQASPDLP